MQILAWWIHHDAHVSRGAATHYTGEAGFEYFEHQRRIGELGATLDRQKFTDHVNAAKVVLDFGCGGGYPLARLPAARRIGVEPNDVAREQARQLGLEVHASLAPVAGSTIDVVISNHALEHTLRPYDDLTEIRRVLKPDGKLSPLAPARRLAR